MSSVYIGGWSQLIFSYHPVNIFETVSPSLNEGWIIIGYSGLLEKYLNENIKIQFAYILLKLQKLYKLK